MHSRGNNFIQIGSVQGVYEAAAADKHVRVVRALVALAGHFHGTESHVIGETVGCARPSGLEIVANLKWTRGW